MSKDAFSPNFKVGEVMPKESDSSSFQNEKPSMDRPINASFQQDGDNFEQQELGDYKGNGDFPLNYYLYRKSSN
jgi:hypothetical protein